jgi:hypothetical protein
MGFMDKAKKMAEQAQEKLDEVQTQFNENQSKQAGQSPGQSGGVTYDEHGRPVERPEPSEPAPKPSGGANTSPDPFKPIE